MNKLLRDIIKITGVSYELMRSERDGEYLLTYSNTLRVCIGFNGKKEQEYYNSCAWSCDAVCYILCSDNKVYLHSPLLDTADCYDEQFVLDRIDSFFVYLKRFHLKENHRICNFICDQLYKLESLYADNEELTTFDVLAAFWEDEMNFIDDGLRIEVAKIREGFFIGKHRIVPDLKLIRRFVAPQLLDVFGLLHSAENHDFDPLKTYGIVAYRSLASYFLPTYIFKGSIGRRLRVNKELPEISVYIPFYFGSLTVLSVVRELRSAGYQRAIKILTHCPVEFPQKYYEYEKSLLDDELVEWNHSQDIPFVSEWPKGNDIVVSVPPYKFLDRVWKLFDGTQSAQVKCDSMEGMSLLFMRQAVASLNDGGIAFLAVPISALKVLEFEKDREKTAGIVSVFSVDALGMQSYSLGLGPMCIVGFSGRYAKQRKKNVEIRWCNKSVESLDLSLRESNRKSSGGIYENVEVTRYALPEGQFSSQDWSPRPYSESYLISVIKSAQEKTFVPVSSLFNVQSGVSTGFNQAFIIDRNFYDNLSEKEQRFFLPAATRESLKDGQLLMENYVFYPYLDNVPRIVKEVALKTCVEQYYYYLLRYKRYLAARNKGLKSNWWDLAYHTVAHSIGAPKIVSLGYGTKGAFAFDETGSYIVTGGYQWTLKRKSMMSVYFYYAYLAILSSTVFWKILSIYSEPIYESVISISYRLSRNSVESIPVPDLSKPQFEEYIDKLCFYGKQIKTNGLSGIDESALNDLVGRIYGNF